MEIAGISFETRTNTNNHVFVLCRILWLIAISAGFAFSVIVITPLYDRFFNNPIIRSIESDNYPINNISFPAVTICSNNKVILHIFIKNDTLRMFRA